MGWWMLSHVGCFDVCCRRAGLFMWLCTGRSDGKLTEFELYLLGVMVCWWICCY